MTKLTSRIAVAVLAMVVTGSSAWANSVLPVNVTGTIWRVAGNMYQAPTSDPSGTLLGSFTATGIDFFAPGPQSSGATLKDWLDYGSASYGSISNLNDITSNCYSGTTGGSGCYSTVVKIVGNTTFYAGSRYTLTHDDGANMWVTGQGWVITAPAPTVAVDHLYQPAATTSGDFTIYYVATNGNPSKLRLGVPDGGMTLMLLGGALVGMETLRRRYRV